MAEIALLLQSENNDYQQLLREDCLNATDRNGMSTRVFSAENDAGRQEAQLRELLAEPAHARPEVVVVSPVQETSLPPLAREAGRLGVGCVLLNRWSDSLPELRGEFPKLPIFSVTPDQYEIGHVQGRQFRNLLPDGGEVIYVRGRAGTSSAERRYEGVRQELSGTGIQLRTFNSDWSSEGGQRTIEEWLEASPDGAVSTRVVGAQNDSMAAGARRALEQVAVRDKRSGVDRVHVTGCDGATSFGLRLVSEGTLTATVVVPSVAGRAVDEIAAVMKGAQLPPAEIVLAVSSFPNIPYCDRAKFAAAGPVLVSEAMLLDGLRAGDPECQTLVFELCEPVVRRILTKILREGHDVADALQDTFVKVFRSAAQLKDPKALRAWVMRVAESVALDAFRKRERLRARCLDDHDQIDMYAITASVEVRSALRATYRVLATLPEDERRVFALRYIEDLELARIADTCGVSLATVKRRLARAEARFMALAQRQPGLNDWVGRSQPLH